MVLPDRLDVTACEWVTADTTIKIMNALSPGQSDQARFVGGCIRNALMGRPVDDIDIATQHTPEAAMACLNNAGIKTIPTGFEHGTITALVDKQSFEITSLRCDIEYYGRKAKVVFTTDWVEDSARRDFRFNAIYADRDGQLFDPQNGIEDALKGQVVFIGKAEDRIEEDHLRILRFYRFNAWYGQAIDVSGHQACIALNSRLAALSVERVWKELKRLLLAPDPISTVQAMQEGNVLHQLLTYDLDMALFARIIRADQGKTRRSDAILRLCALLGRDEGAMHAVLKRMKSSNAEMAYGHAMTHDLSVFACEDLGPGMRSKTRLRCLYRLGVEPVIARLRLDEAAGKGEADTDIAFAEQFNAPQLPVRGKDLIANGFAAGPDIGDMLSQLETSWIESEFKLDKTDLIQMALETKS